MRGTHLLTFQSGRMSFVHFSTVKSKDSSLAHTLTPCGQKRDHLLTKIHPIHYMRQIPLFGEPLLSNQCR